MRGSHEVPLALLHNERHRTQIGSESAAISEAVRNSGGVGSSDGTYTAIVSARASPSHLFFPPMNC